MGLICTSLISNFAYCLLPVSSGSREGGGGKVAATVTHPRPGVLSISFLQSRQFSTYQSRGKKLDKLLFISSSHVF